MSTYFAHITPENIVDDVVVADQQFIDDTYGANADEWVETFMDTAGKTYAGIGFEYLEAEQDFRPQQPYPSWTWSNKIWNPPTPMPSTGGPYRWSEEDLEWVAI